MILGISEELFTTLHVIVSLIGIGAGFVVAAGMLQGKLLHGWTGTFLWTTVLTSVSGFGFPAHKLLPSHVVGILSLIALAIAIVGLYVFHLRGGWHSAFTVTALLSLYFNVFVAIVQAFLKVPALHALAPTQKEPPFGITQLFVLLAFSCAIFFSVRKQRPVVA